jgi:hypothetical protein
MNTLQTTHAATGPAATKQDAGVANTFGVFTIRVVSSAPDCVVALETSPDNTTWTEQCRVTGDGWGFAASNHRRRYARVNAINLGTGASPLAATISSYN